MVDSMTELSGILTILSLGELRYNYEMAMSVEIEKTPVQAANFASRVYRRIHKTVLIRLIYGEKELLMVSRE